MSQSSQASERQVVTAAVLAVRGGDPDAFARVVEMYQRRMFGLLLMMMGDRAGAEDVMQESFIRAYSHLESYDLHREFYPWLATIAVRLAQNWLKHRGRLDARESAEPAAQTSDDAVDLLGELIEDERARHLWRVVASLPRGERMVVLLHYREEMKVSDIGKTLGVTDGTVKTMLHRARRKLRMMVGEAEPPPGRGQERAT